MQGGGSAAPPWLRGPLEIAVQIGKLGTAVVETHQCPNNVPSSFGIPDFSNVDRLRQLGIPIEVVGQAKSTGILAEATVIFKASSWASKAVDCLLSFSPEVATTDQITEGTLF